MYKIYTRKQEFVIIGFILALCLVSTYFIYNKFSDERKIDYNSENLEVIFNDKTGDKITLKKITPLNDSVGLSTKAHNFELNNNLTEKVNVQIKLEDDLEIIDKEKCNERLIPKDNIKVMIKKNNIESDIYRLSELDDGIILEDELDPIAHNTYAIRLWVDKDTALPAGSNFHYHGIIKIIEEDSLVSINR